ncbi:MAG: methyltransferase domain-containing protein [Flavobacteriales bacterium]
MSFAPIVIFAYKRPDHLRRTLHTLSANPELGSSDLFFYCDGAKEGASHKEQLAIDEVRSVAKSFGGAKSVQVVARDKNLGLAANVLSGVDDVVSKYGTVIVVEDDVELSPHFLSFMNRALDTYKTNQDVGAVGSWNYFASDKVNASFFLRYPDSIAWATWVDRWNGFIRDGKELRARLQKENRLNALNGDGKCGWFSEMLDDQIEGRVNSWAVRWTASLVLQNKLTVFPKTTLSRHIGFDESATHESGSGDYNRDLVLATTTQSLPKGVVKEDEIAYTNWLSFNQKNFQGDASLKARVWRKIPPTWRRWYKRKKENASNLSFTNQPVSSVFGIDRGTPIDRFYIHAFLRDNRSCFTGDGIEVGEVRYLDEFLPKNAKKTALVFDAGDAPAHAEILSGDLTRKLELPSGVADVFVCTQTLNFIFELRDAIEGIHHLLKPGGVALITLAGITQLSRYDADRWGDFWRFTPQSAQKLFDERFGKGNVSVQSLGNPYAAHCILHGMAVEECEEKRLLEVHQDYPVVVTVIARKP